MQSKLKLFGHPIHPMLVVFPLGLFGTSVIFDILYLITRNSDLPVVSYYMIAAGLISGLLAALFGAIDWLGLPYNSRAWNMGIWHGIGNFMVLALFMLNWLRRGDPPDVLPNISTFALSFAGIGLSAPCRGRSESEDQRPKLAYRTFSPSLGGKPLGIRVEILDLAYSVM